jgi:hypothetical protein
MRCLLFRETLAETDELAVARRHLAVYTRRSQVPPDSEVIGRYSVLPYYQELELDLADRGAKLIQTTRQHHYIADLGNWVDHLAGLTPPAWRRVEEIPTIERGPFVVKGKTSSRKDRWSTHMFARDRAALGAVCERLLDDTFIEAQGLYIRPFVPLRQLCEGAAGMPITAEYRFFVARGRVLAGGFYWSSHADAPEVAAFLDPGRVPPALLAEVVERVGDNASFYTIDVAERADGGFVVIELNEGQMAGLSCVDPEALYSALAALP